MKNITTKDALNIITNVIYERMDKSEPIDVTFLGLAKVFDTVHHEILLDNLSNYFIRGNVYNQFSIGH